MVEKPLKSMAFIDSRDYIWSLGVCAPLTRSVLLATFDLVTKYWNSLNRFC